MVAATLDPVNATPGTVLVKAIGPVPAGQEWSVNVRVCNTGTTADIFDLRLRRTDGSNASYRARGKAIDLNSDPYDVEVRLPIPAGYELWHRSGAGSVDVSYTGTFRATA